MLEVGWAVADAVVMLGLTGALDETDIGFRGGLVVALEGELWFVLAICLDGLECSCDLYWIPFAVA